MAEILAFRGLRYRLDGEELASVLAPPYDVISTSYRDALYARDPRNVIRMVLNRLPGDAGYEDAGATLERLRASAIIAKEDRPALYVVEQRFAVDGKTRSRLGVIARCRAEDLETGSIRPHEHTRAAAKEDRWRMLVATRANFSPLFLLHDDPAGALAGALEEALTAGEPLSSYTDDGGVSLRLVAIYDDAVSRFAGLLATGLSYVADGHHRYATALRHRDTFGPEGAWTMAYFTPLQGAGLVVQPYHRVLASGPSLEQARKALSKMFRLHDPGTAGEAAGAVAKSAAPYAFALAGAGQGALVAEALSEAGRLLPAGTPPALAALDTYFLHHGVLPLLEVPETSVDFVHSLGDAEAALEERRCPLAVLLRGTPVEQIRAVADAGLSMPPKSTFFHPKLPSGLVIHEVERPVA